MLPGPRPPDRSAPWTAPHGAVIYPSGACADRLEAAIAKKARWHEGERLGRYELKRRLGAGAFAEVWLADELGELGFRKKVALKLLKSADDEDRVAELLSEARLVAGLAHPNIVGITRISPEPVFHMAMEYVDGGTILELIERMAAAGLQIPPSVVLAVGLHVARALGVAHHNVDQDGKLRPIVHRDLKPANILLARSGFAKVADFGLAKAVGDATATATGMLKGTPAYVAPEIWKGQREFGPPVDLFALGCILYEMGTGSRLMDGGSIPEIFAKASMGRAADEANELATWCPPLVPIIRKLLERDPSDRYQDTEPLITDLQQAEMLIARGADLETFLVLVDQVAPPEDAPPPPLSGSLRLPTKTDPTWAAFLKQATGTDVDIVSRPVLGAVSTAKEQAERVPDSPGAGGSGKTRTRGPKTSNLKRPKTGTTRRPSSGKTAQMKRPRRKREISPLLIVLFGVIGLLIAAIAVMAVMNRSMDGPAPIPAPPPSADVAATPADIPVRDVTPARPDPTPRQPDPTPAPAGDPSPAPSEPTPEPSTPESTPAPAPDPTPAPVTATTGCLQLASRPSGGVVWLNGAQQSARALSNPRRGAELEPGSHTVEMGQGSSPSVKTAVRIQAGESLKVTCFLTGSASCSVGAGDASACN